MTKVVMCCPTVRKPLEQTLSSIEASVPLLDAAGIEHQIVFEIGSPYISCARAEMLRKALDAQADIIVFIDHDMGWSPRDLPKLIEAEGDVVCGTYRFKKDEEEYMATLFCDSAHRPIVRRDGCIKAQRVPAGFLKITKKAVDRFMTAYPELCFGPKFNLSVDLFNHGAHEGVWYGEDYAFSRRWIEAGGDIWIIPDLNLDHHSPDKSYPGNFHEFLMAQPGGSKCQ